MREVWFLLKKQRYIKIALINTWYNLKVVIMVLSSPKYFISIEIDISAIVLAWKFRLVNQQIKLGITLESKVI